MEKKTDSTFIGVGVGSIFFFGMGIWDFVSNKNGYGYGYGYLIDFAIGGLFLAFLLYLLRKTKNSRNERFEDERKILLSEKSSCMSFNVLFIVFAIMQITFKWNTIVVDSSLLLLMISMIALLIKFSTYLICRYKY
ncbi:MAG: hypothetical protein APF81_27885 [Desulfosporosinus sp. BRH_c37]|nr:MAG: hypothetical protein APF81_27885 [Desulfosporosinus sp. BRH_c37]